MVTRLLPIFICAFAVLGLSACKKSDKELKAQEEANWRNAQKAKAVKNYQDLVKKYPESPYTEKAKERLRALGPVATPAKK